MRDVISCIGKSRCATTAVGTSGAWATWHSAAGSAAS